MTGISLEVKMIRNADELEKTDPFRVKHLLWGTKKIPETYGYLGFVAGDGFYLKMVCEEPDPLRTYKKDFAPVYRDSAMEAFFLFESCKDRNEVSTYLNFEANANGALLAAFGQERTYRSYFSREDMRKFDCKSQIEDDRWSLRLRMPIDVLEEIYGPLKLGAGSSFTCNFYKISENKEIEHYASYAPVLADVPSFHLPEFFAEAKIVMK